MLQILTGKQNGRYFGFLESTMKRSARVAPIRSPPDDNLKPVGQLADRAKTLINAKKFTKEEDNSDSSPLKVSDEKSKAKRQWSLLGGSIRTQLTVQKAFQKINASLLNEKNIDQKNKSDGPSHCLLQLSGEQATPNVRTKVDRKVSLLVQTSGCELINYFIELSRMEEESSKIVDYSRLQAIFDMGVDINKLDNYGQSVLHEVARIWHKDVAKFLLNQGISVDQRDSYGRTPLHVASAADYPEMVEFLLNNGADINARTSGEYQTPIHYAAKNDADMGLKVLLDNGADINDLDYKGRSPLQLAAELDRSISAQILLERGAPACVYDESKMGALVVMIQKMPNVALDALDQLHEKNRASRKQYFYLNFLIQPTDNKRCFAKSPLEAAIESNYYNLLLHPVFQQLIEIKWRKLARLRAWGYGFTNICISLIWTARLCNMPSNPKNMFVGNIAVIGVLLDIIAVIILLLLISSEIRQYLRATRNNTNYKEWREEQLEKDLKYAHPQWPEEKTYIEREIRELRESYSAYQADKWNYFDWLTYVMMTSTIIAQSCNIYYKTKKTNDVMRGIGSVTLIFLWLRLLRYALPFHSTGLFVVMLSHVVQDTFKLLFLLLHFCVPYMAAFWINFGIDGIEGYTLTHLELLYNLFQIIVVGDYDWEGIVNHSQIMSRLLCGSFIFFAGIICLNLFIALLSDTFQRVYDNAKATAVLERAKFINEAEIDISSSKLKQHREWIVKNCGPLVLYYDDDTVDSDTSVVKRLTHQIKKDVCEIKTLLENRSSNESGPAGGGGNLETLMKDELSDLKELFRNFQAEYLKSLVQTRAEITGFGLMLKELMEKNECRSCSEGTNKNGEEEVDIISLKNRNDIDDMKNQHPQEQYATGKLTHCTGGQDNVTLNDHVLEKDAVISSSADSTAGERNLSNWKLFPGSALPPLLEKGKTNGNNTNQSILQDMSSLSIGSTAVPTRNTISVSNNDKETEIQLTDQNTIYHESSFNMFPLLNENEVGRKT